MIINPTGDFLIRIKNAILAGRPGLSVPKNKQVVAVSKLLLRKQYLSRVEDNKDGTLGVVLERQGKKFRIAGVRNFSRPGFRRYLRAASVPRPTRAGMVIISTSKGVISGEEAKKKNLGGELLGEVW
mgnify:CR=1 FL=1